MSTLFEQITEKDELQLYAQEKLLVDVSEEILHEMAQRNISKTTLANKLGKSKAFVTRLLNGEHNMTLRTLADVCFALELTPRVYIDGSAHSDSFKQWQQAYYTAEELKETTQALNHRINLLEKRVMAPDSEMTWQYSKAPALRLITTTQKKVA